MQHLGNLTEDQTIYFRFSTHKADGTPITLAGSPVVKVYKNDATTTETATGVALTVDHDGVTGSHNVKIDTSADAFYAVGADYSVVITTGTVDGVSVVGTVLAHFSIENRFMEADLTKVNGSATTATLDSISAQISGIGSGTGAALNFAAAEDNASTAILTISKVGTQTGTFANVANDNGTYHVLTHATNNIDWVYGFNVGSGRVGTKAVFVGYLAATAPATGKTITVQAYNFLTTSWDAVKTITGQAGTTDITVDIALLAGHTGTGANAGKVYVRFTATSQTGAVLNVDQLYIAAQNLGQTAGYVDGAIWIGGANGNTTPYVDGTADNPCTYAAAKTIAASTGLTRFRVRNGTTVTLDASAANKSFIGNGWTLALGGQAIDGAFFSGAEVSGTGTCTTQATFEDCHINAGTTLGPTKFIRCGFAGTSGSKVTAGSAGEFLLIDCYSEVAGSGTPYFAFPGVCGVNIRRWSGGSNITLDNTGATLTMEVVTGGGQTIAVGGADVELRGICRSVTLTGITTDTTAQIDAVTGPISLAGADGTVNIYGVCGVVTDSRTGTPLGTNKAVGLAAINAEADTAISDAGIPAATAALWPTDYAKTGEAATASSKGEAETARASLSGEIGALPAPLTAQETRDALKLAPTAGTPAVGSADQHLDDLLLASAPSAATIADAVWDEALAGHSATGTAGKKLTDAANEATVLGNFGVASGIVQAPAVSANSDLTVYQEGCSTITFTLGTAWNLTGKEVWFVYKSHASDTTAVLEVEATVTDAVNGIATYTPTVATFPTAGKYAYEVYVCNDDAAHTSPQTAFIGNLFVKQVVR